MHTLLLVTALATPIGDCSSKSSHAYAAEAPGRKNIVETAVAAGNFKTLAAALGAADLAGALSGDGPFTVFAPTDEAFAQLPAGTVDSLLQPENLGKLTSILKYHVVAGDVRAKQVVGLDFAQTLGGQRLDVTVDEGGVRLDSSRVTTTDIECTNGVIHVIDRVLMPATNDIVGTAVAAGTFETLAAALGAGGLVEALQGEGPFTVFAPTDDAFAALPEGTVESLLRPENRDKLVSILKYHVVSGRVFSDQAAGLSEASTLQGSALSIQPAGGTLKINDAKVVSADIQASNGVIHVVDRVLLPN